MWMIAWLGALHHGDVILRQVHILFFPFNGMHCLFVVSLLPRLVSSHPRLSPRICGYTYRDHGAQHTALDVAHDARVLPLVVHEAQGNAEGDNPDDDV